MSEERNKSDKPKDGQNTDGHNAPEAVDKPLNTGRNPDGTFAKGSNHNPAGKPRHARHRTTVLLENIMRGSAEKVLQSVLRSADQGDTSAAKIIIDRMAPVRKSAVLDVPFDLPIIQTPSDAVAASAMVLAALADGTIGPDEADALNGSINAVVRTIESAEIDARLKAVEEMLAQRK